MHLLAARLLDLPYSHEFLTLVISHEWFHAWFHWMLSKASHARVPEATSGVGQQLSPCQQAARGQVSSHILLTKFKEAIDDRGHALQRNIQSQMPHAQCKRVQSWSKGSKASKALKPKQIHATAHSSSRLDDVWCCLTVLFCLFPHWFAIKHCLVILACAALLSVNSHNSRK